jgi:type IV pilus assembly protein PilE
MVKGERGVTLIEVMVVVAIVGMLAAIAIPAYNNYITRSRRADAFSALLTVRAAQEMYRAERGFYASAFVDGGNPTLAGCSASMAGNNYGMSVTRPTTPTTFEATATAQAKQASDRYSQFRINQNGQASYFDTQDSAWHTATEKQWEDLR